MDQTLKNVGLAMHGILGQLVSLAQSHAAALKTEEAIENNYEIHPLNTLVGVRLQHY